MVAFHYDARDHADSWVQPDDWSTTEAARIGAEATSIMWSLIPKLRTIGQASDAAGWVLRFLPAATCPYCPWLPADDLPDGPDDQPGLAEALGRASLANSLAAHADRPGFLALAAIHLDAARAVMADGRQRANGAARGAGQSAAAAFWRPWVERYTALRAAMSRSEAIRIVELAMMDAGAVLPWTGDHPSGKTLRDRLRD